MDKKEIFSEPENYRGYKQYQGETIPTVLIVEIHFIHRKTYFYDQLCSRIVPSVP